MKYLLAIVLLAVSMVARAGEFLPVLMYHHVTSELAPAEEVVSLDTFTKQMRELQRRGYKTVTLAEATVLMASGSLPAKHIAVTFDDGWKSQLQAAEVLRSMKYTATFFIITGTFETPRYMSASDVKFLSKTFEIGAHSETHFMEWANDLSKLDVRVMHGEIAGSKFTLENLTGKWITSVSWPFGFTKPGNVEFAKHLGFITQAMVYTHKRNEAGSDPHQLSRLNIDGRCSIDIFLQMVQSGVEQHCK